MQALNDISVMCFSSASCDISGRSEMVILFEWHPMAMDQTSRSGLPLSGEETDLEALSSPLVGYLGKVSRTPLIVVTCAKLN